MPRKLLLSFALLVLVIAPKAARGQTPRETTSVTTASGLEVKVGAAEDSEEVVAWKYLRAERGINSREDLKAKSLERLNYLGQLPIKYQRVEVDGVSTTDDTSDKIPGMFDKQFKMSYMNETPASGNLRQSLHDGLNWARDLYSAAVDMDGEPTAHAKEILAEIHNQQVNELFAHSWGTEAVYAAILSGFIPPPKKLVLIGIPEENEEQWRILAKYTGIEVHVVGFSTDKVQIAGNAVNHFITGLPRDPAKLEKLWQKRCAARKEIGCADPIGFDARKFDYNVNVPAPRADEATIDRLHLAGMDHDRIQYYEYLYNRGLFNKTVAQLDAPQQKLIEDEEDRTLSEAMGRAQELISEARDRVAKQETPAQSQEAQPAKSPDDNDPQSSGQSGDDPGERSSPVAQAPQPVAVAPGPIRVPAAVDPGPGYAQALKGLAISACDDGPTLSGDGITAAIVLGISRRVPDSDRISRELSGCSKWVFDRLVQSIARRDFQTRDDVVRLVNAFAHEARQPTPNPVVTPRGPREPITPNDPCKRAYPGYCND